LTNTNIQKTRKKRHVNMEEKKDPRKKKVAKEEDPETE